ncbi:hypothetical protein B602_0156 [Chlamydia psittaci M56]|nr:hypothetical protein B602_0156 [Chlamydia psittaci M56]
MFSIFGSLCLSGLKIHKLKNHSASSQSLGDVMRSLINMDRLVYICGNKKGSS